MLRRSPRFQDHKRKWEEEDVDMDNSSIIVSKKKKKGNNLLQAIAKETDSTLSFIPLKDDIPVYASLFKNDIYSFPWGTEIMLHENRSCINMHFIFEMEFSLPAAQVKHGFFTPVDIQKVMVTHPSSTMTMVLSRKNSLLGYPDKKMLQHVLFEIFRNIGCILRHNDANCIRAEDVIKGGKACSLFVFDFDINGIETPFSYLFDTILTHYLPPFLLLGILIKYDKSPKTKTVIKTMTKYLDTCMTAVTKDKKEIPPMARKDEEEDDDGDTCKMQFMLSYSTIRFLKSVNKDIVTKCERNKKKNKYATTVDILRIPSDTHADIKNKTVCEEICHIKDAYTKATDIFDGFSDMKIA